MPKTLAKSPRATPLASLAAPAIAPSVAPWGFDRVEWAESPARLLHERLVATFVTAAPADIEATLSPRAKLAILVGSSAVLWLLIGLAVAAVA